jgi:hypothetical protein
MLVFNEHLLSTGLSYTDGKYIKFTTNAPLPLEETSCIFQKMCLEVLCQVFQNGPEV